MKKNMRKKYRPKSRLELRKLILNEEVELGEIDTSKITDMSHLFEPTLRGGDQARFFYNGIETWDVSNVTDMSFMFCYARNFNEDITNWDTSKVKNMRGMFQFASSFNQDISKWNVGNIQNMASMFYDAAAFNQNLDSWDVSKVKTMRFMFMYARYFEKKPIWDMTNVEDEVGMYYGSPIVYVDPNVACGIDPTMEAIAEKESLDKQMSSTLEDDGIAQFAKNLVQKSTTLADRLDARFEEKAQTETQNSDDLAPTQAEIDSSKIVGEISGVKASTEEKTQDSTKSSFIDNLERLQKLKASGLLTDEEFSVLKQKIISSIA